MHKQRLTGVHRFRNPQVKIACDVQTRVRGVVGIAEYRIAYDHARGLRSGVGNDSHARMTGVTRIPDVLTPILPGIQVYLACRADQRILRPNQHLSGFERDRIENRFFQGHRPLRRKTQFVSVYHIPNPVS